MIRIIFKYLGREDVRQSFAVRLQPDQIDPFIRTLIDHGLMYDADLWQYVSAQYLENDGLFFVITLRQIEIPGG